MISSLNLQLLDLQFLADGILAGAMIGLGAIGVTLTYAILRFSNFAHGEFVSFGAYATLLGSSLLGAIAGGFTEPIGPFSFGWGVVLAGLIYGVAEALITALLGSTYTQIVTFALVILALALRPNGLFGRAQLRKA